MRRGVACLLLALLLGFLAMAAADPCDATEGGCAPLCHAGCVDGCSTAPVPSVELSLPGTLAGSIRRLPARGEAPLSRSVRPLLDPPRA